jgi:hypothetical protein
MDSLGRALRLQHRRLDYISGRSAFLIGQPEDGEPGHHCPNQTDLESLAML